MLPFLPRLRQKVRLALTKSRHSLLTLVPLYHPLLGGPTVAPSAPPKSYLGHQNRSLNIPALPPAASSLEPLHPQQQVSFPLQVVDLQLAQNLATHQFFDLRDNLPG